MDGHDRLRGLTDLEDDPISGLDSQRAPNRSGYCGLVLAADLGDLSHTKIVADGLVIRRHLGDAATSAAPQPEDGRRRPMLLTDRDVEAELQLGRTRAYELIRSGDLPVVRCGRMVRVPRHALHRWIEDHQVGAAT